MLFRKIATILLLTFLFFNWVGYWLFISWFESRETARWETRIDNARYSDDQLVLLKVSAAAVPYSNASVVFERAAGEIEIGDIHYSYVRKRLYNDSIEFLCIPHKESSWLLSVKSTWFGLVTDSPDNGAHRTSSPAGKATQVLLKAFWQQAPALGICNSPARDSYPEGFLDAAPRQGHSRVGKQPPKPAFTLAEPC